MSWFTSIFSNGVDKVVDSVGKGLDNLFTSDEERLLLRNKLEEAMNEYNLNLEKEINKFEGEITARHANDMASDSWLSKNIRPLALVFILGMYSMLSISSGFDFMVTESYVSLLGQWGMLIMSFYFGGRSIEKIASIYKKNAI